jgi:UDP-N-acetylmuramate: L-alanyl-gamma-D-glutamyl-meso-diaminopimelate ligase
VFQEAFTKAFGGADQAIIARVYRSSLPEDERLSVDRLVDDLRASGTPARHLDGTDDIIRTIVDEHERGDVVLVMSNGAFDGIHRKLVAALQAHGAQTAGAAH